MQTRTIFNVARTRHRDHWPSAQMEMYDILQQESRVTYIWMISKRFVAGSRLKSFADAYAAEWMYEFAIRGLEVIKRRWIAGE